MVATPGAGIGTETAGAVPGATDIAGTEGRAIGGRRTGGRGTAGAGNEDAMIGDLRGAVASASATIGGPVSAGATIGGPGPTGAEDPIEAARGVGATAGASSSLSPLPLMP